jgi:hypothetical protein
MIPITGSSTLSSNKTFQSFEFGIDVTDSESIKMLMNIMRNSLYTDKILAIIREYSTNALDANIENGYPTRPILVTLPNLLDRTFKIRDYGKGLSVDDVKNIYTKFGKSTKRNSNAFVGQLGVGCKAGFAYGDNFVVISYHNKTTSIYNCVINGSACLMSQFPMNDGEEDGIEIQIPVIENDIENLNHKALHFFKHWDIHPIIVGIDQDKINAVMDEYKDEKSILCGDGWKIKPSNSAYTTAMPSVVLMGNVTYNINWDVITENLKLKDTKNQCIFEFIKNNRTILKFDIGELEFSANREGLQYTKYTCEAINKRLMVVFDSILDIINLKISTAPNIWEAYKIYNAFFDRTLGVDTEFRFIGGLYKLEPLFKETLKWNDIRIENGGFRYLNEWDFNDGYNKGGWTGKDTYKSILRTAIMSHYDDNALIKGALSEKYNYIMPSHNSMVLIDDVKKPRISKMICAYLLHTKINGVHLNKVYVLKFKNDAQKSEFYNHYNFHTVPTTNVSDYINDAKKWAKTEATINNKNFIVDDLNSRKSKTICAKYIDINNSLENTNKCWHYRRRRGVDTNWSRETVSIKSIVEPVYYVDIDNDNMTADGVILDGYDLSFYAENLYYICKHLNLDVKRIYGISKQTRDSKWFNKDKKDNPSKWRNIFVEIKKAISQKSLSNEAITFKYLTTSNRYIGLDFANSIHPKLLNKNTSISKLCEIFLKVNVIDILSFYNGMRHFSFLISHFYKTINAYTDSALTNYISDNDLVSLINQCEADYPMLSMYSRCLTQDVRGSLDVRDIRILSDYINVMDSSKNTIDNSTENK